MLASLPASDRQTILSELSEADLAALEYDWRFWARRNQIAPGGDWTTWLILAGRGFGKTRSGAEWIRSKVEGETPLTAPPGGARRIALVAETAADARDVMVEGESGLLACSPPDRRPLYEPSKRRLTWPNGAVATLYNAVEPDQLRGPQHDAAWCDEIAKWRYAQETWDQLQFGLRLGDRPQQVLTTTPRAIRLLKEIIASPSTVVTRGSTYDNRGNLAPAFFATVIGKYEGTRLGRQELNAEILDDMPGALWSREQIDLLRLREAPPLRRIVVAIDPATTNNEGSDESGLIVAGLGHDNRAYILQDASMRGSPDEVCLKAVRLYRAWQADRIIAEVNNGGDWIESLLRTVDSTVPYRKVNASRGKAVRAEPASSLYEQGRVHHVGSFPELEDQMCAFTIDFDRKSQGYSPDRVDALVWALAELYGSANGLSFATV